MLYLVDGKAINIEATPTEVNDVRFGILESTLKEYGRRGQKTVMAQFLRIVIDELSSPMHCFRGLERDLYCDGDLEADERKLVYSMKPKNDAIWTGKRTDGEVRMLLPPSNTVFVIIVSPNIKHQDKYPEVYAWINRWNWVGEDPSLPGAPKNWVDRYTEKLYSFV